MKEQLKQFITDNNLKFTEGRRNTDSVILSGYALHIGVDEFVHILYAVEEALGEDIWGSTDELENELTRVFEYADCHNYGNWWKLEEAKKKYKF